MHLGQVSVRSQADNDWPHSQPETTQPLSDMSQKQKAECTIILNICPKVLKLFNLQNGVTSFNLPEELLNSTTYWNKIKLPSQDSPMLVPFNLLSCVKDNSLGSEQGRPELES